MAATAPPCWARDDSPGDGALPEGLKPGPVEGRWVWEKDGASMVLVPGGGFTRGSGKGGEPDESPAAAVEVSLFYMDEHEVTNSRFSLFVRWWKDADPGQKRAVSHPDDPEGQDRIPAWWPREGQGQTDPQQEAFSKDDHPVAGVSWFDAFAYARWAGKDLPTETEWEKAASTGFSGQDKPIWPWGSQSPDFTRCNFGGNVGRPVKVGSYPSGRAPCKAADMSGNVWEWCLDFYHSDFYKTEESRKPDPSNLFPSAFRVVRGGSYRSRAEELRVSFRDRAEPHKKYRDVGFRCVLRVKK